MDLGTPVVIFSCSIGVGDDLIWFVFFDWSTLKFKQMEDHRGTLLTTITTTYKSI